MEDKCHTVQKGTKGHKWGYQARGFHVNFTPFLFFPSSLFLIWRECCQNSTWVPSVYYGGPSPFSIVLILPTWAFWPVPSFFFCRKQLTLYFVDILSCFIDLWEITKTDEIYFCSFHWCSTKYICQYCGHPTYWLMYIKF